MQEPQGTSDTVIMESLKTVVVKPHQATDDTQLDLKVNDIVYVLEQDETGWWGGHKAGEETTGWFPGSCVRPIFEPGTLGHQQLTGVVTEEQAAQQSSSSACRADEGPRALHPALETETRSPVRRSLLVASPQRGGHHEPRAGDRSSVAIPGTPAESSAPDAGSQAVPEMSAEMLAVQVSKLKQENTELSDAMKAMKRQSDVDRRNCTEMEAAAEAERQRREELERRLQAENSEKERLLSEATTLRKQVEKEKAQQEAMKHMESLYKSQLEEKEEELRRAGEQVDHHRRSQQSEKQRMRSLEEQVQVLSQQLEGTRQGVQPRAEVSEQTGAAHCQRRLSVESAHTTAVDQTVPVEAHAIVMDETRRRLFSSTASNGGTMPTPASDRVGQYFDGFVPMVQPSASPVSSPTTETSRGRALTTAGRNQPATTAPSLGHQQAAVSAPGSARGPVVNRPPEPPRAASTAPRAGSRGVVSPNRLFHAHSTGDLDQRPRALSVDPGSTEDAPPRGCVADKVTMFEQRCQTPRRDGSEMLRPRMVPRSEPHDLRPSRSSREDQARATPPALPRLAGTVPPMASLVPPLPQQAQTTPTISVTPPAQVSERPSQPQRSNSLQVPAAASQPGVPASSIQAIAAQFQARSAGAQDQVLSGRPGSARPAPRGLELPVDDDDMATDQVNMGMSPIYRPQPAEQSSSSNMLRETVVSPTHAASAQYGGAMGVGASGGASSGMTSARSAAASRESSIPEVSVLERIRKLEVR